ncbi:hypothetical protein JWG41_01205 [Leptospira sp. 201903075]|uniref:class I SAM-dependent methyltransferase n=1 Tax=Leptospira chreensis TaxID=2810035 RepID=UPI0019654496|nr:hypothetical protein [Leptospira chreensis]MBM9589046.1 hypothetical protein [Leptospira chreensis]
MNFLTNIYKRIYYRITRDNFNHTVLPSEITPRVHVGCGPVNLAGWINVDARGFDHVHIVSTKVSLDEFADGSVGEIYMCHVLEHFKKEEGLDLLKVYSKKLKKGGIIRIAVPSFDLILDAYQKSNQNLDLITASLLGGQDYEYNYHKIVFNKKLLSEMLSSAGFINIEDWTPEVDFGKKVNDWSSNEISIGLMHFPVSLNLKARIA